MKATTVLALRIITVLLILLFLSTILSAQVTIKEKVEINPKISIHPPMNYWFNPMSVHLDPIPYFGLTSCGGWADAYDNIYDDEIFVPRFSGVLGIAYDNRYYYNLGTGGWTPWNDTLLVFGKDGKIKYAFQVPWEQYAFSQDKFIDDSTWDTNLGIPNPGSWGYYPVISIHIHVDAWEPLRFRHYNSDPSRLVKPNHNSPLTWVSTYFPAESKEQAEDEINFYHSFTWDYCGGMELVFRDTCWEEPDYNFDPVRIVLHDYSAVYPMRWDSIEDIQTGGGPDGIESSAPVTIPDSGKYRVIINYVKNGRSGPLNINRETTINVDENSVGDTIVVGPYSAGTSFEISNGNPTCIMSTNRGWIMSFETENDYEFDDIRVIVENTLEPPDHLELWSTYSIIYYGDTVDVDIVPVNIDTLFSRLGSDADYEFSVEVTEATSQYGQLIYQGAGGTYFEHIPSASGCGVGVKFAANGIEPDSTVDLTFRLTASYIGNVIPGKVADTTDRTKPQTLPVDSQTIKKAVKKSYTSQQHTMYKIRQPIKSMRKSNISDKSDISQKIKLPQNTAIIKSAENLPQTKSASGQTVKKRIGHPLTAVKNSKGANKAISQKTGPSLALQKTLGYVQMDNYWTIGEGPEPELELDYPTEDQIIEGNTPPVWTKPIKARLANFKKGDINFYWDMKVEWFGDKNVYTPIKDCIYQQKKDLIGKNDEWFDLGIKVENPLLGGNKIKLHVKAIANGKTYETNSAWLEVFQIKGKNPPLASILSALGDDKYIAIACYESGFNHFHKRTNYDKNNGELGYEGEIKEFPYQGVSDPTDIGIMQINLKYQIQNPSVDAIIWDWTVNAQVGKSIFNTCYSRAVSYHLDYNDPSGTAKDAPFDEEERFCEAYCEYNGGIKRWYWDWEPLDSEHGVAGGWVRSNGVVGETEKQKHKCITAREYADDVDSLRINHPWR